MRVGIIGCGNISDIYVRNAKLFKDIEMSLAPTFSRGG